MNTLPKKRNVVVTGAAGGIGFGIAKAFAEQGDKVFLVDINKDVIHKAALLGNEASAYVFDVSDENEIINFRNSIEKNGDFCQILVNCAGISLKKDNAPIKLQELTLSDWNKVLNINLTAPFLFCRAFIPKMKELGFGRIVNISSITARTFRPRSGLEYSVAKSGIMGLTRRLSGEFAPFGITINNVAPGRIDTPLLANPGKASLLEAEQAIPMKRLGTTEEVASAVCYLASNESSYITGACLDVNGGDYIA